MPRVDAVLRHVDVAPGQSSAWIEVGSLLDTFMSSAWNLPRGIFTVEIAVPEAGAFTPIAEFAAHNTTLQLLFDASTRATRRVRPQHADFFEVLARLDRDTAKHPQRRLPTAVPVYASTFTDAGGACEASRHLPRGELSPCAAASRPLFPTLNASLARFSGMLNFTPMYASGRASRFGKANLDILTIRNTTAAGLANRRRLNSTLQKWVAQGARDAEDFVVSLMDEVRQ